MKGYSLIAILWLVLAFASDDELISEKKRKSSSGTYLVDYSDYSSDLTSQADAVEYRPVTQEKPVKPVSSVMTWATASATTTNRSPTSTQQTENKVSTVSKKIITVYPTMVRPNLKGDSFNIAPKLMVAAILIVLPFILVF